MTSTPLPSPALPPPSHSTENLSGEYLTFRLGAEEYGIGILKVQEIRSYEEPTHIANTPTFIRGVVNLRGIIVPIVDLRLRLGCSSADFTALTVVVVLSIQDKVIGAIVDSVSDVVALDASVIKPPPTMGHGIDTKFITGIACVQGDGRERTLILLQVETLLMSTAREMEEYV